MEFNSLIKSKFIQNVSLTFIARLTNSFLFFVWTIFLMSYLDVDDFGVYSWLLSVCTFTPFFINLGTDNGFISDYMSNKNSGIKEKLIKEFVALKLILIIISFSLIFIILLFSNDFLFFISCIAGLMFGLFESSASILFAKKRFNFYNSSMLIKNIFLVIISLIFWFWIDNLMIYLNLKNIIYLFLFANFFQMLPVFFYLKRPKWFNFNHFLKLITSSKFLFFKEFSDALMMRSNIFILTAYSSFGFTSESEIAYFSAAFTFCMVLPIIVNSFIKVALPEALLNDDFIFNFNNNLKKLIKPIILIMFMGSILIPVLIYLLFGEKYYESIPLIPVIIIAISFSFYAKIYCLPLYKKKFSKRLYSILSKQLLTDIIASIILTYHFGAIGAAFAILISRILGFILSTIEFNKYKNISLKL